MYETICRPTSADKNSLLLFAKLLPCSTYQCTLLVMAKKQGLCVFWQIQATNNGIRIIMKSKCVSKMQRFGEPLNFFFLARTNCPFYISSLKYHLSLQGHLSATTSNGEDEKTGWLFLKNNRNI